MDRSIKITISRCICTMHWNVTVNVTPIFSTHKLSLFPIASHIMIFLHTFPRQHSRNWLLFWSNYRILVKYSLFLRMMPYQFANFSCRLSECIKIVVCRDLPWQKNHSRSCALENSWLPPLRKDIEAKSVTKKRVRKMISITGKWIKFSMQFNLVEFNILLRLIANWCHFLSSYFHAVLVELFFGLKQFNWIEVYIEAVPFKRLNVHLSARWCF